MVDLSRVAFKKISSLKVGKMGVKIIYLGVNRQPDPEIYGKIQRWKK
jgi:rare lipoprotein A (peptidoglycan hydrolase)